MFKDRRSSAIVAVKDIDRARKFYGETLGLVPIEQYQTDELTVYRTGSTELTVYVSDFAGTNKANAVAWDAGDETEKLVAELKGKGVVFEHYPDMPGELNGDIHEAGGMKLVWFKDPDGNILHFLGT